MGKAEEINHLTPEEVEQRLVALRPTDCAQLERIARVYAWGTSWTASDLLQEAVAAALETRQWRADLSTTVFLVGAMKSIAHSKRKSAKVALLDKALAHGEEASSDLAKVQDRDDTDPAVLLEEEQQADQLLNKLMTHFSDDPQVQRVIQGRIASEAPGVIKAALGLNQSQYETVCRRLTREYHNIKVEKS